MKKKAYIIGAGGHGRVVLDILLQSHVHVAGFIDEDPQKAHCLINGFKVWGNLSFIKKGMNIALGIGNNQIRNRLFTEVIYRKALVISAIHPNAVISPYAKLGKGIVVMAGVVVNANAILEEGVVVNTSASVDHDCYLEKFCQIWPGAHLAGNIKVGSSSYVGTGASVIPNIKIGSNALVGAGSVVVRDVNDHCVVAGSPARVFRRKENK